MTHSDDFDFLDELNLSELVSLAWAENPNAHRSLGREALINIIVGTTVELPDRRIDVWRRTIYAFVDAHWRQVEPLLSCPMKSRQPHACFQCPDVQVAECVLVNHQTLIDTIRRKKRETT
jgi:hypothetical protein